MEEKSLLLIMQRPSESLSPGAKVSLCLIGRVGALKTQNVKWVYYDLKADCVFKKVGWMFCNTEGYHCNVLVAM